MAGTAKTTYLSNKFLNHVLKNTAYVQPATVYLALFTVSPGEAGAGTEATGGSYARQAITFGVVASGSVANTVAVTFSTMPAATITDVAICDASTAGNVLYFKALSSPITTSAGDDVTFAIGNISVAED